MIKKIVLRGVQSFHLTLDSIQPGESERIEAPGLEVSFTGDTATLVGNQIELRGSVSLSVSECISISQGPTNRGISNLTIGDAGGVYQPVSFSRKTGQEQFEIRVFAEAKQLIGLEGPDFNAEMIVPLALADRIKMILEEVIPRKTRRGEEKVREKRERAQTKRGEKIAKAERKQERAYQKRTEANQAVRAGKREKAIDKITDARELEEEALGLRQEAEAVYRDLMADADKIAAETNAKINELHELVGQYQAML